MSTKPVIFHIAKWYPNRHDNLLAIFVKRHILSTIPHVTPVVFYGMASDDVQGWYDLEESEEDGIYTYRYYYRKKITRIPAIDRIIKLIFYTLLALRCYYVVKSKFGKPQLIHTHVLLRTAVVARFIEWIDSVPYVILEHSSSFIREDIKAFKSHLVKIIARHVVKHAQFVMTVSQCLANGMRKRYGLQNDHYEVVYNCVNTNLFSPRADLPVRSKKEFVYVAEFDEVSKNTKGLLEVFSNLSQFRNDFILYVVGYGKDEAILHQTASDLGLKNHSVFFTGKLVGSDLVERIKNADALLLFSNFETLSCVITEALCCGTPVISTAVGGVVEIVNAENGILVPKADQQAMVKVLNFILDGEVVWDSNTISQQAQMLFSNEAVGDKMYGIYKKTGAC